MKTYRVFVLLMVSLGVLVGCGQQPADLPTLAPTVLPGDLPTDTAIPTEAPAAAPLVRPTFPPTWTPSPAPQDGTPAETPPSESADIQPLVKPTLEVCGPFRDDRERYNPEFPLGSNVTVAWIPVESATNYRIRLVDENDNELLFDVTTETTYTFSGDLFESGRRYGWNVYPMDVLGQQMCFDAGNELFPS